MDFLEREREKIFDLSLERDLSICRCGAKEGQFHQMGCDFEHCPKCGGQISTCDCTDKTRIPYISYPNICARCGKLWPDMFMVPDNEWNNYIEPNERDKEICWDCYLKIKRLIDKGKSNVITRER